MQLDVFSSLHKAADQFFFITDTARAALQDWFSSVYNMASMTRSHPDLAPLWRSVSLLWVSVCLDRVNGVAFQHLVQLACDRSRAARDAFVLEKFGLYVCHRCVFV